MDGVFPATHDEATGAITSATEAGPANHGVVHALANRAIAAGARVLGARKSEIPEGADLAVVLRYQV